MKQATIAIFLICMLAFSHAANLRKSTKMTPLEQLEDVSNKSKFASNLFVTINLSLQSGGRVDEVIDFVREAKSEQIIAKNDLVSEYKEESARLSSQLEDLQTQLTVSNGQLDIILENIDEYTANVTQLQTRLNRLQTEQAGINDRRQALEQARENDIEAFRNRQRRDTNTINALTEIIPALENLQDRGDAFLEKSQKEIMVALQKIPENKPIQMLVQLSTKFDSVKLSQVIEKLAAILESVEQSRAQDAIDDETSNQRYQTLAAELEALRWAKSKDISAVTLELNNQSQLLKHNVGFRTQTVAEIQEIQAMIDLNTQMQAQNADNYEANLSNALDAIEALNTALEILTSNETQLESQEQAAENDQSQ